MFSAFTGWGMLEFSSQPPRAESIYNSIVSLQGGNFEDTFSGPMCADWYGTAMAVGAARDTLARAENQADPNTVEEMLPVLESMYQLPPGPFDNLNTRRATLSARYLVAMPPTATNVGQALRVLLGSDFVAWVPNTVASPSPATIPSAMCKPPTARIKVIRLLAPVFNRSVVSSVPYRHELGDRAELFDGDTIVIDPGARGLEEVVTVHGAPAGVLTATFTATHEAGTLGTIQPFPNWSSFKKNSLVVVKRGRANDPAIIAKVRDLLERMLSGTSTWDVVQENIVQGTAGPIRVGEQSIGMVPLGALTFAS